MSAPASLPTRRRASYGQSLSPGQLRRLVPGFGLFGPDDDALDVEARGDDALRVELAQLDDLVHLGDGDGGGAGHGGVEGARGPPVDEVAVAVGLVGADE